MSRDDLLSAGRATASLGTSERSPKGTEPQDRLSRSVRWLSHSTQGIRRWVAGLALVAGVCCCVILNAVSNQSEAQALGAHGQWLVSNDVQVDVIYENTKSGGYWTIDGVRVRFPGSDRQVPLENVNANYVGKPLNGYDWKEGWQAPTAATGYQTPLSVIVRHDPTGAIATGMSRSDYSYLAKGNTDPEVAGGIGAAALALAALSLPLNRMRLARNKRLDLQRRERIATTGPRSPGL